MSYAVTNSPENCEAIVACGGLKVCSPISQSIENCNSRGITLKTMPLPLQAIFPVFMGRASAQRLNKKIRKHHGGQGKALDSHSR